MEPQARYVFVGTVVVLLVSAIALSLLWLSVTGVRQDAEYYTIYFRKHALNGLQLNSDVTMRGIKVGQVRDLQISKRNIEQVRVDLLVRAGTPVKTDTVAIINRNLLTGFALIDLAKGTQDAERLQAVQPGETYPVIPEGSSELEQLAETLPDLLGQAGELTSRLRAVLSDDNVKNISGIIENVHQVTEALAKNKVNIESMITAIDHAAQDVSRVSHSLSQVTATGGQLDQISNELLESLREIHDATANINRGMSDVLRSVSNASQVFAQQITTLTQSLSESSRAASITLQNYEHPRTLLSGPHKSALGPGEHE